MLQPNFIYTGDVLHNMRTFPDKSVDCIVTSPPYWQQRRYGWKGEWGLEPTFHLYLANLWAWADECYRVLKDTGTLWVNLGDTYMGGGGGNYGSGLSNNVDGGHPTNVKNNSRFKRENGLPAKSKILIPHRFAIGCMERGWIVRNDITWAKPNGMAESVKDRFSNRKEFFFLMSKAKERKGWKDTHIHKATPVDLAWLAAMADGEGSFFVRHDKNTGTYQACLTVANNSKAIIDNCMRITGLGHVNQRKEGIWYWTVTGGMCEVVSKAIYPYILAKKEQIKVGVRLQELNTTDHTGISSAERSRIVELRRPEKHRLFELSKALKNDYTTVLHDIPEPGPFEVPMRFHGAHDYYFDLDSIRDKHKAESIARQMRAVSPTNKNINGAPGSTRHSLSKPRRNIKQALRNPEECLAAGPGLHPLGRNPGDVSMFWDDFEDQSFQDFALRLYLEMKGEPSDFWSVATQGKKTDHFATYNPKLIHKPILAGCPEKGIVLDPFAGTGTTVLHAIHTGRIGVGIEGNPKWAAEANANVQKMLSTNLQFA